MVVKSIAYLAPELPALWATYIYAEILTFQKLGVAVQPFSVVRPAIPATEPEVRSLQEAVRVLYDGQPWSLVKSNLALLVRRPGRYLRVLVRVIADIGRLGALEIASYKLLHQFFHACRLALWLQEAGCEHLHVHFAHTPTQIAMYAAPLAGLSFTFVGHANDLFERGCLLPQKVTRSSGALLISEYNRQLFLQQQSDPTKLHILRCSVDSGRHTFVSRTEFNEPPVVGSLGRLVEKKGFDDLIRAVALLEREGLSCHLTIAGDGPLRTALEKLAVDEGIAHQVEFLGSVAHSRALEWMRGLDAFALACKTDANGDRDGIPVVLMEAMAVGTPVVSTRLSGIPELIEDNLGGRLAEPGNPESLAATIRALLTERERLPAMTLAARKRIETEFDLKVNCDRLLSIFSGIVEQAP